MIMQMQEFIPAGSSHAVTHRYVGQHFLVPGQSPSSLHSFKISPGQATAMNPRLMHLPGFSVNILYALNNIDIVEMDIAKFQ